MSQREIRSLTGLRGIAACYVMLYHYAIYKLLPGVGHNFFRHGYLSVDMFFVLSGFVMALTYGRLFSSGFRWHSYWKFLGRRVARVYPLFAAVTLVTFFYYHASPQSLPDNVTLTLKNLALNLGTVNAWGLSDSILGPGWSISTEFAAYLLFPFLIFLCLRGTTRNAVLLSIGCAVLFISLATLPMSVSHIKHFRGPLDITRATDFGPLVRCILEFSFGLLANRLYHSTFALRWLRAWAAVILTSAIAVLLAVPGSDLLIAFCLPFLIVSVGRDDNAVARALGNPLFHWLGVLSYSIYLTHIEATWFKEPLINLLPSTHRGSWTQIAAQALTTLLLAILTYNIIEKPGRKILRLIFEPNREPSDQGSPNLAAP